MHFWLQAHVLGEFYWWFIGFFPVWDVNRIFYFQNWLTGGLFVSISFGVLPLRQPISVLCFCCFVGEKNYRTLVGTVIFICFGEWLFKRGRFQGCCEVAGLTAPHGEGYLRPTLNLCLGPRILFFLSRRAILFAPVGVPAGPWTAFSGTQTERHTRVDTHSWAQQFSKFSQWCCGLLANFKSPIQFFNRCLHKGGGACTRGGLCSPSPSVAPSKFIWLGHEGVCFFS